MQLTLYWRLRTPNDVDYTAFIHLLGPPHPDTVSPVWGSDDHEPGRASYPTSAWSAGEIVIDAFVLRIPPSAPAETYDLEVGFYQLETMQRLPVLDPTGAVGDRVLLGNVGVGK